MALDPVSAVLNIGQALIEKLIPDPKAKAEAAQKLLEMQQAGDLAVIAGQVDIDKIEAGSSDKFTSRWRPFIGWVCGIAFAMQMVVFPLVVQLSRIFHHPIEMVVLDTTLLTSLLFGMLGFGGMRTVEKLNGVAK